MSSYFRANNWNTWVDNNYSPIFSEKMLKILGNWKTGRETGDVIHICFFFEKSAKTPSFSHPLMILKA